MRLSTFKPTVSSRLPWLAAALLSACTVGAVDDGPSSSVQCTQAADGSMICTQNGGEDDPGTGQEGDDPGQGGDDGNVVCSSDQCSVSCEGGGDQPDGSGAQPVTCVIECENGLRCEQSCTDEGCTLSCTCPDNGGEQPPGECDPGAEDCPTDCDRDPGACQPPDPDYCEQYPDSDECKPDCDMNPDGEGCQEQPPTDEYCAEHPDAPECCQGGTVNCDAHPDDPSCN